MGEGSEKKRGGGQTSGPHLGVVSNVMCFAHLEENVVVYHTQVGVMEVRGEHSKPLCSPFLPRDLQRPTLPVHLSTSDVAEQLVQCEVVTVAKVEVHTPQLLDQLQVVGEDVKQLSIYTHIYIELSVYMYLSSNLSTYPLIY